MTKDKGQMTQTKKNHPVRRNDLGPGGNIREGRRGRSNFVEQSIPGSAGGGNRRWTLVVSGIFQGRLVHGHSTTGFTVQRTRCGGSEQGAQNPLLAATHTFEGKKTV
jgi:hypothetical protein